VRFRLGSIPVHVRAPFLFLALLLAASTGQDPRNLAIASAIIFVAVLVHELGHAAVGRAFGLRPQIELHGMGGTTSWIDGKKVGNARSIAISLAGPFAGFLLYGIVLMLSRFAFDPREDTAAFVLRWIELVCVGWGIANLVPMLPLDGGNVMRAILDVATKGRGEKPARIVSIGVAGLVLVAAVVTRQIWIGFLAALFTFSNVQALRLTGVRGQADAPLLAAIEKSYPVLEKQDGAAAMALLRPVLVGQASPDVLAVGLRLYAYALLLEGEWRELMPLLAEQREIIGDGELRRYAEVARGLGRVAEAEQIEGLAPRPRAANDFA